MIDRKKLTVAQALTRSPHSNQAPAPGEERAQARVDRVRGCLGESSAQYQIKLHTLSRTPELCGDRISALIFLSTNVRSPRLVYRWVGLGERTSSDTRDFEEPQH